MPNQTQASAKKKLFITLAIFLLPVIFVIVAIALLLKPPKSKTGQAGAATGFNKTLPEPNLPKDQKNKLEIYMEAQADSIKLQEERKKDPYSADTIPTAPKTPVFTTTVPASKPFHTSTLPASPYEDPNEKRVNDQLKKLYQALAPGSGQDPDKGSSPMSGPSIPTLGNPQTAQLQQMMALVQKKDTTPDPKLQQISNLLDKVLAIKNPSMALPGISGTKDDRKVLPVGTQPVKSDSSDGYNDEPNGFYGLTDETESSALPSNAIQAVIHGNQTVQTGSIVKLRLLQPIYVGDTRVPANSFIFGPATISGERVQIQLTNAITDGHIYPLSLKVYDGTDGLEGLYVPGAITRDVVKENMSQGVSGLSLTTLDQSVGAQAAAAGIETAKNLISHKIRIVKVTLKEGHLAILKTPETGH